jgi:hypothetical protein
MRVATPRQPVVSVTLPPTGGMLLLRAAAPSSLSIALVRGLPVRG